MCVAGRWCLWPPSCEQQQQAGSSHSPTHSQERLRETTCAPQKPRSCPRLPCSESRVQVKVATTERGKPNQNIGSGFFQKWRMADQEEATTGNTEEGSGQVVMVEKEGEEEDDPLVIDEEKPPEQAPDVDAAPEDVNEADEDDNEKEFEPTVSSFII